MEQIRRSFGNYDFEANNLNARASSISQERQFDSHRQPSIQSISEAITA